MRIPIKNSRWMGLGFDNNDDKKKVGTPLLDQYNSSSTQKPDP